jgi:hypothetical protein
MKQIGIHVTSIENTKRIKEEGLKCHDYSDHPVGTTCSTFAYPPNGVDENIKYWPQNARMRGVELDSEVGVAVDLSGLGCKVGDLHLEGPGEKAKARYLERVMSLEDYSSADGNRRKFEEPEVVCNSEVSPERVICILKYSDLKELFEACEGRNECIIEGLLKCERGI